MLQAISSSIYKTQYTRLSLSSKIYKIKLFEVMIDLIWLMVSERSVHKILVSLICIYGVSEYPTSKMAWQGNIVQLTMPSYRS